MNLKARTNSRLGDALFSKTQQKVLGLLYGHPDDSFFVNQILRSTGMGVHTIKRELDRMTEAGILTMSRIGNQHHYRANHECPIFPELLGIVRKTFGIADVIRAALKPRDDEIEIAFIYGSIARAEDTAKSDIDLFIVSNELAYSEVMELLFESEKSLGRTINPTIYTLGETNERMRQDNAFIVRILEQPKIWIKEDEDVYRSIGESGKGRPA